MSKIIKKDITTAPADIIICHQVNCKGAFGSGVAAAIANKWPEAKKDYLEYVSLNKPNPYQMLGHILITKCKDSHTVIHMFSQYDYGRGNKQYTNYLAFENCLLKISDRINIEERIAFPWKIGCGLGGGDWNIIYSMIEEKLNGYNIIYCKLEMNGGHIT